MAAGLRHPDWYLVAEQRFRRRAGIREVPQRFRREEFLVLWDALTGQSLRLGQRAAVFWRRLDGELTVDGLWRALSRDPATAPTQREVMDWVLQLVSSGLILSDHALDPGALSDRSGKKRDRALEARAANPLSVKIPVFDPSGLLRATWPLVRWLFTPFGALLVGLVILAGLTAAVLNLPALLHTADTSLLTQSGVLVLFLSYPVMKALHELAHGWAVLRFGGEVREAGVMLLLFVPVPYVDASEATTFPDPRARMLVGAAGILAELVIASIALLLWLVIEPGVEKAVLYSFIVMGSLSTLLFNGNPLLKFDAYYVLADWLEMPNLATRAGSFLSDLVLTRGLGLRPETRVEPDEARILGVYGAASLAYRLSLTLVIVLVVSKLFYALGLVLALWALAGSIVLPLAKLAKRGWKMAEGQNRKRRMLGRIAALSLLVGGLGGFVPLPFSARGEGQVVPTPAAELRLGASGMILPGVVADGLAVSAGAPLLEVVNPDEDARLATARLRVDDISERLTRGGLGLAERADLEA
ncbi:MAG: site-2 protease family protein, partial [Cereibacter changlensis]